MLLFNLERYDSSILISLKYLIKLFLFFKIKHVTTKIDLNQEYVKNFQKTYLKLQKDCI
jgi:hypothetical protein